MERKAKEFLWLFGVKKHFDRNIIGHPPNQCCDKWKYRIQLISLSNEIDDANGKFRR